MSATYWRDLYGKRSRDFIDGVIAGVKVFARWENGVQVVGYTPLDVEIANIKKGLGWKEVKNDMS